MMPKRFRDAERNAEKAWLVDILMLADARVHLRRICVECACGRELTVVPCVWATCQCGTKIWSDD
jgi:hypothetical protein